MIASTTLKLPIADQPMLYVAPIGIVLSAVYIRQYEFGIFLPLVYLYCIGFSVMVEFVRLRGQKLLHPYSPNFNKMGTIFYQKIFNRPQPSKPQWFPSSGGLLDNLWLHYYLIFFVSLIFWFNLFFGLTFLPLVNYFISSFGLVYVVDRLLGYRKKFQPDKILKLFIIIPTGSTFSLKTNLICLVFFIFLLYWDSFFPSTNCLYAGLGKLPTVGRAGAQKIKEQLPEALPSSEYVPTVVDLKIAKVANDLANAQTLVTNKIVHTWQASKEVSKAVSVSTAIGSISLIYSIGWNHYQHSLNNEYNHKMSEQLEQIHQVQSHNSQLLQQVNYYQTRKNCYKLKYQEAHQQLMEQESSKTISIAELVEQKKAAFKTPPHSLVETENNFGEDFYSETSSLLFFFLQLGLFIFRYRHCLAVVYYHYKPVFTSLKLNKTN